MNINGPKSVEIFSGIMEPRPQALGTPMLRLSVLFHYGIQSS